MNDNQFRSLDIDRININEYYEVEYWAKQFGFRPDVFKNLIEESGITSAEALKAYLHKKYGENVA
jgi:hypothetical protein